MAKPVIDTTRFTAELNGYAQNYDPLTSFFLGVLARSSR
jgi:hypothetical protein